MAALPYNDLLGLRAGLEIDLGVEIDITDDGETRLRAIYDTTYSDVDLVWPLVTVAQSEDILSFLRTHRLEEIEFSTGGKSYIGRVTSSPSRSVVSSQWHRIGIKMRAREVAL